MSGRTDATGLTIGVVGPVPPRRCGVAEETAWTVTALAGAGAEVRTVAVGSSDAEVPWTPGLPGAERPALRALAGADAVLVEYRPDLYGPPDAAGDPLVRFLQRSPAPTVLVLHDVPNAADPVHLAEVGRLVHNADAVVVHSDVARRRVLALGERPPAGVHMIPRAAVLGAPSAPPRPAGPHRPTIVSFGFLDPDKGVEDGIVAVAALNDLSTPVRYLVVGPTSTDTLALEDEHYRSGLRILARALKVDDRVVVDGAWRSAADLARIVHDADVVLLPYVGGDVTSSAVLVEAVAAGRPVVSTAFPHAVELLADGAGALVSPGDQAGMTNALRRVLTRPRTAAAMCERGAELARAHAPARVLDLLVQLVREIRPVHDLRTPVPVDVDLTKEHAVRRASA